MSSSGQSVLVSKFLDLKTGTRATAHLWDSPESSWLRLDWDADTASFPWPEFHRRCGSSVLRPSRNLLPHQHSSRSGWHTENQDSLDHALCVPMLLNQESVSGLVISSGVQRRVSTDIRTGSTVNALQTLSKAQLLQQLGRSGRTDCGVHITMMSHDQYLSQVRSSGLAQLEESDISPMILHSLVAGRSFARLPFLCPPHPLVQTHAKEKMLLHGILDERSNEDGTCHSMHGPAVWMGAIPVHLRWARIGRQCSYSDRNLV